MGGLVRRKRLQDGTFGDFEKVFDGETPEEKIERLENENANITFALIEKDMKLNDVESSQAMLLFQLIEKGVL
ncbi:hypothetical protein [Sporosarcina psychrophila]|uniref:Uncharacterized protein n=1 Tax=Sporosarcina psychrophila TaxID=1476 RepID=A0ABV2KAB0_SPOPS